jgi:hypothetical protein
MAACHATGVLLPLEPLEPLAEHPTRRNRPCVLLTGRTCCCAFTLEETQGDGLRAVIKVC